MRGATRQLACSSEQAREGRSTTDSGVLAVSGAAPSPAPGRGQTIAALLRREAVGRFRAALPSFSVDRVCFAHDLFDTVRLLGPSLIAIEPWDAAGAPLAPAIRLLKSKYPSVPIVVCCEVTAAALRETFALSQAGADAVIVRGVDDAPDALRTVIDQARTGRACAVILRAIQPHVSADAVAFIRFCVVHARDHVSVERAAKALGIEHKTLQNRIARERLPSPREILAWCRLLVAAHLLEDSGRSVEQVGFAIGCGSGAGLRNLFLRHTGERPARIRRLGGMEYVLDLFVDTLREARTRADR